MLKGLKEDKITWYSNLAKVVTWQEMGLEEDKIAGGSKRPRLSYYPEPDWKAKEPDNKRV